MSGAITATGVLAATAVAGVGMEAYGMYQQSETAGQARDQSGTVFGEQQQYAQMLNKLISDPSSVKNLPGYQFNLDQGSKAIARNMAGTGFAGSGNEAIALEKYGQDYATSAYTTQANLLASLAGLGSSVNPTQSLGVASGAQTQSNAQLQQLLGTLTFAGSSGMFGSGGTNTTPVNPTGSTGGTVNQGGYIFGLPAPVG